MHLSDVRILLYLA